MKDKTFWNQFIDPINSTSNHTTTLFMITSLISSLVQILIQNQTRTFPINSKKVPNNFWGLETEVLSITVGWCPVESGRQLYNDQSRVIGRHRRLVTILVEFLFFQTFEIAICFRVLNVARRVFGPQSLKITNF